ncbi:WD40/YVTN/BNR-like repeat-containing protein [Sanyastnella coralliicola]|uniref:WD40/YVTN/BNR-like repeat-containing protein n=1 Tax=Sanyastnella coralliicola TaxID=3069118 RepID=UPI0027B8B23D|nr:hypothetical protein [Longitalea sp. SCSIO 12813]
MNSLPKFVPTLVGLLLFSLAGFAQVDMDQFKNMDMRHVGPGTMSGRVTSIDVVRDQPNVIYVGTASGGLWKSVSGGITWEPIFDDQAVQSIGALKIDPSNPDVIWAGTGEGNPRNSHTSGAGIYKSIDGGKHWTLMGLEGTKTIHRIIVHRNDPNTVWVAAPGSAWGPSEDRGIYKTTDGGETWNKVLYVNDETGCADLIVDPVNPNKLFAAMWEHGRKPWTFNSGGEGSGLYVSFDGGETWTERTEEDGLPKGDLGRIGLAVSAANPNVVYALVEAKKNGLYKSTDGGFEWELVSTKNIGNRPFYYADIYAHPGDENTLFNLYSMVSKSIDGGKNFNVILPYSGVHPDHHAFYIHPDDHNYMINGNDGGLNISRDGGKDWEFITNLPVGQFYHINYDMATPYHVYGGMQDNGSWQGPGYVWHSGGIRNEDWQEISFGDGFDVVPDPSDLNYAYSMSQGGYVSRVNIETGDMRFIQPRHPEGETLRFNWNAAIAADPHNENGVYFGSQYLHRSADHGESWEIISPDLTTNDTTKQQQAISGGLSIDATGAENFTCILCIEPSIHDKDVIWVGTDDGHVQVTRDGGKVWQEQSERLKGLPEGSWIAQIIASPHNPAEAFVVANNYRRNDWNPYVYHTTDYGGKWTRIVDEEMVSGHSLSLVQDPIEENLLFLGTENGLYVSFDKGSNWNKWEHDYPAVSTMDLKIHPREHDLIIGTFGRGVYILDDIRPLRATAESELPALKIFEPNTALIHSWKRPRGARFGADHLWAGSNKRSGAALSWYVLPDSMDAEEMDTKANLYVLAMNGDTLRSLELSPDSGVTRSSWWMDTKGVNFPSRRKRNDDSEPGGGPTALPGDYKLVLEYKGMKDSTILTIDVDERMEYDAAVAEAAREHELNVQSVIERAEETFTRIREAQDIIGFVNKQITIAEDTLLNDLKSQADSLNGVLKDLEHRFMRPEEEEGYDSVTERIMSHIWTAYSYADFGRAPGQNAINALDKAKREVDLVIEDVNAFFNGDWKAWQEEVEKTVMSPFKDWGDL